MFHLVKNVIADKEITCQPKRTLPTIIIPFYLIQYNVGIELFISFPL